ncbi:50S ribosomal protein L22 [Candidatus Falkowbacteria bacterium]|nr:50S ribosomal protein L22 [Candidatus Falkowbacteria bacterium]
MQVTAKAKYVRMSPRKMRLVIDVIRGLPVSAALTQLQFSRRAAAKPIKTMVESAVANAVNNFKLDKSNLYISTITANEGPTLKRWMPRAFGRATPIRKRSTHLAVILTERVPTDKAVKGKTAKMVSEDTKKDMVVVSEKPKESVATREDGSDSAAGPKGKTRGFTSKLFNRKAG